jgi:ribosomal protein S18 acetylase RimI-like enzyme
MNFNIRALNILDWNDQSSFIEIYKRVCELMKDFYIKYDREVYFNSLRSIIERPDSNIILAENDEKYIVGMCVYNTVRSIGRTAMFIDEVYVDPKYRGNYIGIGLINFCEDLAKKKEYDSIELVVNNDNDIAMSLYSACGFLEKPKKYMVNIIKEWKTK